MSAPPLPPDERAEPEEPETELETGRTPRDDQPPVTEGEPGREPRRSGESGLPGALRERFPTAERLAAQKSGQADLYLVREGDGPRQVLKLYHDNATPDAKVWRELSGRRVGPELVHISETGRVDGRHYELMEYLAGGTLVGFRAGRAPDTGTIAEIARQLAEALRLLHERGIAHRDVKPGNVLLRSAPGDPLELALIDFGISRLAAEHDIMRTISGTVAYQAPEAMMGRPTTESDWWSLGVVLYELATGKLLYDVHDGDVIKQQVAAGRPVGFDEIADAQVRLLCRGLLLRDPRDRWGYDEIQHWLAGDPPELADFEPAPQRAAWPLPVFGQEVVDTRGLAEALEQRWERAAERYFTAPGHHWWQLRKWLLQFDDPDHYDLAARKKLLRRVDATRRREPAHALLLRLLLWLDPDRAPTYRRQPITPQTLVDLAQRAILQEPGISEIIADLWHYELLPLLATAEGNAALGEFSQRWRELGKAWDRMPKVLARHGVTPAPAADAGVLPYLLWLAIGPETVRDWVDQQIAQIGRELPTDVPWFTALRSADGVLDRLRAVLLRARARSEAAEIVAERERITRLLEWERRRDRKIRWHRDQQRLLAVGWAGAGAAVPVIAMCWAVRLADLVPLASPAAIEGAWAAAVLFMVVVLAGELTLALVMGGLYYQYRHYALLGRLVLHGSQALRPFRHNAWPALPIIIGLAALLVAATTYVPYALPFIGGLAHLYWTVSRHLRWRREWSALTPEAEPHDSPGPPSSPTEVP